VVARHPDDESLGCGGLIALMRQRARPVFVVFATDGAASRLRSASYPPQRLRLVRAEEARRAMTVLGVPLAAAYFMGWADGGGIPGPGSDAFEAAVDRCCGVLSAVHPSTLILPWRREPHPDDRSSAELFRHALARSGRGARVLEYPIAAWEQGGAPMSDECSGWRLDISSA